MLKTMLKMATIRSFFTLFTLLISQYAHAIPVLDQSTGLTVLGSSGPVIMSSQTVQQSVTVGIDGLMSQIDVQIYQSPGTIGNVDLSIRDLTGGILGGTLATFEIQLVDIFVNTDLTQQVPWTSINVSSAGLLFNAGDTFAIELSRQDGPNSLPWVVWSVATGNYVGGNRFIGGVSGGSAGGDQSFQTWVTTVPEPSIIALIGSGLVGISVIRRRRIKD